jgi:hypothetical protein
MTYKNTGVMCMVTVADANRKDGIRFVDLGNYFTDDKGNKFLFTSLENAKKYWQQVNVPILIQARGQ